MLFCIIIVQPEQSSTKLLSLFIAQTENISQNNKQDGTELVSMRCIFFPFCWKAREIMKKNKTTTE